MNKDTKIQIFKIGKKYAIRNDKNHVYDFVVDLLKYDYKEPIQIYPNGQDEIFDFLDHLNDNYDQLYGELISHLGEFYETACWCGGRTIW